MVNIKGFSDKKLMMLEEIAENHTWNNKDEIKKSDICMCLACYQKFLPQKIDKWQDGNSAICPNPECGLGGSIIGSASGLNFSDYDYS